MSRGIHEPREKLLEAGKLLNVKLHDYTLNLSDVTITKWCCMQTAEKTKMYTKFWLMKQGREKS